MPRLTRWFLRTSSAYLLAALLVAILLALRPFVLLPGFVAALTPVYFHLFLVGWVTQTIFGVVYWLFPRPDRGAPRGGKGLMWATYGLLNAGLLLRVAGEPTLTGWLLTPSALLQWLAGLTFATHAWTRVQGKEWKRRQNTR